MSKKPTTTRKASAKQEKYVATSLNGRVVSNSGATSFSKGDVTAVINEQEFIIECKTKMKESLSLSIKKEWLEGIKNEQLAERMDYSALVFDFGENKKTDKNQYIILDLETFKKIGGA